MTNEKTNKLENEVVDASKLKSEIENMIENASTHEDLNSIGAKLNYAINNKYNSINVAELQVNASRKMRQIYNKIGEYVDTD